MIIEPRTGEYIHFCNVPFNKTYEHTTKFYHINHQLDYFARRKVMSIYDFTYIRKPETNKSGILRVAFHVDKMAKVNYLYYKNVIDGRTYFCFVERLIYKNENMCEIEFTLDVWNTYQHNVVFPPCYIERATQKYYSIGHDNTLSDSIATGNLVQKSIEAFSLKGAYFVLCTCAVDKEDVSNDEPSVCTIGGYKLPCHVLYFEHSESNDMSKVLQNIAQRGLSDRILSAVYVPNFDPVRMKCKSSTAYGGYNIVESISKDSFVTEHQFQYGNLPFEYSKELNYPNSKIVIRDNATGQTVELDPDKFDGHIARVRVVSVLCEQPYYKIIPLNYQGQSISYQNAMVVKCNTGLPIANNLYSKYLMNNAEFNKLDRISAIGNGAIDSVGSLFRADLQGVASGAFNSYMNIQNINAKENQASKLGNSVTAIHDGACERVNYVNSFNIELQVMDDSHLKIARDYWKKYGYPVRSIGNIDFENTNQNHYFIKTVDCCPISTVIPQEDLTDLKAIFDNGVTVWTNPEKMYNY